MDYRERARLNQDKSIRIKHMAFAVKSVDEALVNYQSLLSVSEKTEKVIWEKAETKYTRKSQWAKWTKVLE